MTENNSWARELLLEHLTRDKPRTARQYACDIRTFARFLAWQGAIPAADSVAAVEHYIGQCRAKNPEAATRLARRYRAWALNEGMLVRATGELCGYAQATANRLLICLRSLATVAEKCGFIPRGYKPEVELLKGGHPRHDRRGPGREGVMRMLNVCEMRDDCKGRRDALIIMLAFANGLRASEVLSLRWPEDVSVEDEAVWPVPKGGHDRVRVPLPMQSWRLLEEYLELRGDAPGPLFISMAHWQLGKLVALSYEGGLYKVVRTLGNRVGVTARPHGLRHTGETEIDRLTNGNQTWITTYTRHARDDLGRRRSWDVYNDNEEYNMRAAAEIILRGKPYYTAATH